jgi:uncharacterized membrane protein YhiD involved in acid resistance
MDKIKKIFFGIVGFILIISTLLNIRNQYLTLKEAEKKNNELKIKVENMTKLKQKMIKQIEYATSSAFIDQQQRQLLGLGTENDFWLILSEEKKLNYFNETIEEVEIPNYQQWLNLFTQ